MVPLVLCFKTMWSVPDTVSWGADYASYADSYKLVLLSNKTGTGTPTGHNNKKL